MCSLAGHSAVFQDKDQVGIHDRANALGDNQTGCVLHFSFQRLPELFVRLIIKGGKGIVKNVDFRSAGNGAGDGEALLLAPGEVRSVLRHGPVNSSLFFVYKGTALRDFNGPFYRIVVGSVIAKVHIGTDISTEHNRPLRDIANLLCQLIFTVFPDIVPIHEHLATGYVVKSRDKVDHQGLAAAGSADKSDRISFVRLEGDVGQDIFVPIGIAEVYILCENMSVIFTRIDSKMQQKESALLSGTIRDKYLAVGKIGLIHNIAKKWINTGEKETPEEMIDYIMSVITLF